MNRYEHNMKHVKDDWEKMCRTMERIFKDYTAGRAVKQEDVLLADQAWTRSALPRLNEMYNKRVDEQLSNDLEEAGWQLPPGTKVGLDENLLTDLPINTHLSDLEPPLFSRYNSPLQHWVNNFIHDELVVSGSLPEGSFEDLVEVKVRYHVTETVWSSDVQYIQVPRALLQDDMQDRLREEMDENASELFELGTNDIDDGEVVDSGVELEHDG